MEHNPRAKQIFTFVDDFTTMNLSITKTKFVVNAAYKTMTYKEANQFFDYLTDIFQLLVLLPNSKTVFTRNKNLCFTINVVENIINSLSFSDIFDQSPVIRQRIQKKRVEEKRKKEKLNKEIELKRQELLTVKRNYEFRISELQSKLLDVERQIKTLDFV